MRTITLPERLISFLIALACSLMFFTGCAKDSNNTQETTTQTSRNTESVAAESIAETITNDIQNTNYYNTETDEISYKIEDYAGNLDAFVYGLIKTEYESYYSVFNAAIDLPSGDTVYGIGYTDYADCYESDDGIKFFPAGFISLIGEPAVPKSITEDGLEIIDLDYDNPKFGFVLAYDTEPFMEHCKIWGQYLKYGINEEGSITYSAEEYTNQIDEPLGMLYSYDDERFIFDTEFGDYKAITGRSLTEIMDFAAFQADINRRLDEQDKNFCEEDIDSAFYFAKERIDAYLLSMQEETFMGCRVKDLIEMSKTLDKNECIRITPQGTVAIDITKDIPKEPEKLTKWLVGFGCGIVLAGSIAAELFIPALKPLSGAISGAAVDVFMQVVIENQAISNVNWGKVAVSAVSGAMIAWACPTISSLATGKTVQLIGKETVSIMGKEISTEVFARCAGYGVKTLSTAFVSGCTNAAFSAIDGKTGDEIFDSFVVGFCVGGAISVGADLLAKVGNIATNAISKTKPGQWISKYTGKASAWIGKHQIHLKNQKIEDILVPKSIYESSKAAMRELKIQNTRKELLDVWAKQLPADDNPNFIKKNSNNEVVTKKDIISNTKAVDKITLSDDADPELVKMFEKYNVKEVLVKDNVPDLTPFSEYTFSPEPGIGPSRATNMDNYYKQLSDTWKNNPDTIPEIIKRNLPDSELTPSTIEKLLSDLNLTLHEDTNNTVHIVDTYLHSKLSHGGGVSLAKAYANLEAGSSGFIQLTKTKTYKLSGSLLDAA